MALREIDGDPARQLRTEFARRGPWGGLLCAVWKLNKTIQGVTGDLTRPGAVGPANILHWYNQVLFL